jgi:hypothetical protein
MKRRALMCTGAISMALTLGCGGDDGPEPDSAGDDTTGGMETGDETDSSGQPGTTSSDPSDDSTGEEDDTGPTIDVDPPQVLSVSPADGEIGVHPATPIVVTFSEPMDKTATQAAYQSADLPMGDVTMAWNASGDELTITPNDPLAVAEGFSPNDVEALTYALMINTAAQDLAGNALEEDHEVEFSTARLILQGLPREPSLTGSVSAGGTIDNDFLVVGEDGDQATAHFKGFLTFNVTSLPEGILEMAAQVRVYQLGVIGDPYTLLGDLIVHDVEFSTLNVAAFQAASLGEVDRLDSDAVEEKLVDVSSFVWDDYQAERHWTQYRMEFETANSLDEDTDVALFAVDHDDYPAQLLVLYLIP